MEQWKDQSAQVSGALVWSDSDKLCAVSDDERHLGHIIQAGGWQAFDATKSNDSGDSYLYIGRFPNKREAKDAVLNSVFTAKRPLMMTAGSSSVA